MSKSIEVEGPTGVIQRSFHILEVLDSKSKEVSLAELSESSSLNKPTICRMLRVLLSLGYVKQNKRGEYYCAEKLSLLGQNETQSSLKESLQPYIDELFAELNETINLGILKNETIHYVYLKETTQALRTIVEAGKTDLFHTTALGRAIVANLPKAQQIQLSADASITPQTVNSVKTKKELSEILDKSYTQGYAIEVEENVLGASCIAIPVLRNGYPIAAISVTVPTARLSRQREKQIISLLKKMKEKVSQ